MIGRFDPRILHPAQEASGFYTRFRGTTKEARGPGDPQGWTSKPLGHAWLTGPVRFSQQQIHAASPGLQEAKPHLDALGTLRLTRRRNSHHPHVLPRRSSGRTEQLVPRSWAHGHSWWALHRNEVPLTLAYDEDGRDARLNQ